MDQHLRPVIKKCQRQRVIHILRRRCFILSCWSVLWCINYYHCGGGAGGDGKRRNKSAMNTSTITINIIG